MSHYARPASSRPWTPCRRHLFEARAAIAPRHLADTYWLITEDLWEAIKLDPDMQSDWLEAPGPRASLTAMSQDGIPRYLLGQPVQVDHLGHDMPPLLILPVDCKPPRTPEPS